MRRQQVPVDKGEPGKFYYEVPVLITISGKPQPVNTTVSTSTKMIDNRPYYLIPGRCRLESSHKLHGYTPPTDIVYELGNYPQPPQIPEFLRKAEVAGYGEGAIVCRRYQNKGRWKYASQWGIIVITHKLVPLGTRYAPFTVKWFNDQSVESAWPEDLVVIHPSMSFDYLKEMIGSQGLDVEGVDE